MNEQGTGRPATAPGPAVVLKPVTADNLRDVMKLSDTLTESQSHCVARNAVSVAQAHVADTAWMRAVCLGDEPIGFVMVNLHDGDIPAADQPSVFLWRFMIARRWQRRGYGAEALDQLVRIFGERGIRSIYTSCVLEEPEGPYGFYLGYGFVDTGVKDDDEEILRLGLAGADRTEPSFVPMAPKVALITVWTDSIGPMKRFYRDVLGFQVLDDRGAYVEFENSGARFAVCERHVMAGLSPEFTGPASGQRFELAFPCDEPAEVDEAYRIPVERGAGPVAAPADMPWGQRTALFADPDGNVHEVFAGVATAAEQAQPVTPAR